jgi:putative PIN family toxin of toxin-antitoxin system
MGKKKIVIDTNIYISALGWEGNPKRIVDKVIEGEFELILSKTQLEEIKRVLDYPKLGFTDERKKRFLQLLYEIATMVEIKEEVKGVSDDPKDDIILESANEMEIDYIITGEDHLLRLKEFKGAKIIKASEFLERFGE